MKFGAIVNPLFAFISIAIPPNPTFGPSKLKSTLVSFDTCHSDTNLKSVSGALSVNPNWVNPLPGVSLPANSLANTPKVALLLDENAPRVTVRLVAGVPLLSKIADWADCTTAPLPFVPDVSTFVNWSIDHTAPVCVCPPQSNVRAPVDGEEPIALKVVNLRREELVLSYTTD